MYGTYTLAFQWIFVRMKIISLIFIRFSYVSLIRNSETGPLHCYLERWHGLDLSHKNFTHSWKIVLKATYS